MANKNSNHQSSLKGKLKNNLNPAPSLKKTYAFVEFPCGLDEPHEPHTTHRVSRRSPPEVPPNLASGMNFVAPPCGFRRAWGKKNAELLWMEEILHHLGW